LAAPKVTIAGANEASKPLVAVPTENNVPMDPVAPTVSVDFWGVEQRTVDAANIDPPTTRQPPTTFEEGEHSVLENPSTSYRPPTATPAQQFRNDVLFT